MRSPDGCGLKFTLRFAAVVCWLSAGARAAEPVAVTHDGLFKFSPVFCEEGRAIVFAELETPMLYRLVRLNLADGSTRPLHPEAKTSEFDPAFSADGKRFAFLKTVGTLRIHLQIAESDGTAVGEVPCGDGFSGMRSPALAPDRQHVAYSFAVAGRQQIFQVRADGKEKQALTGSRGINNWPAYAPDGRQIVFGSSRDGDFEIYRMNSDGGDVTRLTDSPGQDSRPKFSPDGRWIAFTSHRDGNPEIYLMNADGGDLRRITDSPDRDDYCDWHPDGRHLVFVSDRNGKHELYLVEVHDRPPAATR